MSRKPVKLVLVDFVDMLAVGVHVAARLDKGVSFVENRVGQAADPEHVVGWVQLLIQDILRSLIVQIPLAV